MWVVMLSGEDAESSELYGPFAEKSEADSIAQAWNLGHDPDGGARVVPVRPAVEMLRF